MAKQILNLRDQINWQWRNSMRSVRFFGLDARAVLPFLTWLVYLRWSTIILAAIVTSIFAVLERLGLSFPAALRALRTWVVGRHRPGIISTRHRRFADYGG